MNRKELLSKYSKEWAEFCESTDARNLGCVETLLDYGMDEKDFLDHIVGTSKLKFTQIHPKKNNFIILSSDDWRVFDGQWRKMTTEEQIKASL